VEAVCVVEVIFLDLAVRVVDFLMANLLTATILLDLLPEIILPDDIFFLPEDISATEIISMVSAAGLGVGGITGPTVRHIRMTIIQWATRRRRSRTT
jgi:hypothetical protein